MELNEVKTPKKARKDITQLVIVTSWNVCLLGILVYVFYSETTSNWWSLLLLMATMRYTDDVSDIEEQRDALLTSIRYTIKTSEVEVLVETYNNVLKELDREDEIIQHNKSRR